ESDGNRAQAPSLPDVDGDRGRQEDQEHHPGDSGRGFPLGERLEPAREGSGRQHRGGGEGGKDVGGELARGQGEENQEAAEPERREESEAGVSPSVSAGAERPDEGPGEERRPRQKTDQENDEVVVG